MKALINIYTSCYLLLLKLLNPLQDFMLLSIRVYWGLQFAQTGWGKFQNIDKVIGFFTSLGIPFPEINVYMAASTELIGGILLTLGLASRITAIPLCFTMLVAYLTAHLEGFLAFFSEPSLFIKQTPFSFLFASLIILLFGPGRFSLDRILAKRFKLNPVETS